MYANFDALCADRNIPDGRIREAALTLADNCKHDQTGAANELLQILKAHRPNLVRLVAERLLAPVKAA